ncbi:MAG TPA: RluA family pseudouridine synthase [Pyrinomonadaceae bacterium]|jgi:23S rRNA pseudouridine1911/1915/1917 synthase|nr:RluA family pseudouridine synthase [Pyrinomonadaceae bacterium]
MKQRFCFRGGECDDDQRLDEFLAARFASHSRMYLSRLVAENACAVNGLAAPAGYHLRIGDLVEIELDEDAATAMTPDAIPLEILYEDERLLVLVKPAGMLVHPTRGVKIGTLLNALAHHFKYSRIDDQLTPIRPGLVHRLDRATSGLMVIAKDQRALSVLARHFHERRVEKLYRAVVRGIVAGDEHLIEVPIGRCDEEGVWPKWRALEDGGKSARTQLRVVGRRSGQTLVELTPITGRTNQLRIHCAHLGHPIAGDEWYGAGGDDAARLCLHAARLAFHHPGGNRWLEFNSPLPPEIMQQWQRPDSPSKET